jgi:hypothetical protein
MNLPLILDYQRRFVAKLLSYSLNYDHVLYCMDNETVVSRRWGAYWADFVRAEATRLGKSVQTTEMWGRQNLADPMHNRTFDDPTRYTFVDVSQNNHESGQQHYDKALSRRNSIRNRPRPMNNTKIYGADGGPHTTAKNGIECFWRNLFGGHATVRFHRPASGLGLSPRARRNIHSARLVTNAFDLFSCEPNNSLLGSRAPNEAYCLAESGKSYAVYFPAGGSVTLNTSALPGTLTVRWWDVDRSGWLAPRRAQSGSAVRLTAPNGGQWAVVIR